VDHVHPYDILAMNGASAALMISPIPIPTPVGAVRIGQIEGNFVVNPSEQDLAEGKSDLDLVVAGTEEAILMVEAGANEVPEAEILDALDIAHDAIKKICAAQHELRAQAGKEKVQVEVPTVHPDLYDQVVGEFGEAMDRATSIQDKLERQEATGEVSAQILERFTPDAEHEDFPRARQQAQLAADKLEKTTVRERIAVRKIRPDGRGTTEIRDIYIEAGLLPRTHGSGLFQRGQTQILSVATLGTLKEEMRLDTLGLETNKYYFHHYNFPPFSVGEAGFMRGPKRRDIGHGALAERALIPVVPDTESFPYTIRVVSDILESNGSSSMASVCGSSLSLMQAGVPIKAPVSGIAMGPHQGGRRLHRPHRHRRRRGPPRRHGLQGRRHQDGITAIQMDIKITGVTFEILRDALTQAARPPGHPRADAGRHRGAARQLSPHAPRISKVKIDTDKIGLLIGKGGETIRGLSEEFESQIDVNDDGRCTSTPRRARRARPWPRASRR
jgi:polyribonucleotide nucleotidyltransferase